MFIEKISEFDKQDYIQKLVDRRYNLNKDPKDADFLHPIGQWNMWPGDALKQETYFYKLLKLNRRNVHFGIYQTFDKNPENRTANPTSHEYAIIAAFGDTAVKTYKVNVGQYSILDTCVEKTFDFLRQHEQEIFAERPLVIDNKYIKEFMLPNLKEVESTWAPYSFSHLVADYQEAINNQFAKKKHLAIQNIQSIQKQQEDLGLEK